MDVSTRANGYSQFCRNSAVIPAGIKVGRHSTHRRLSITQKREEAAHQNENMVWFSRYSVSKRE